MRTIAVIPARGGSKGIPHKNIRPLAGHPLIYWVCKAASDAPCLDEVCVATDSEEIARCVEAFQLPRIKVVPRAPHTATDTASTESVMIDFSAGRDYDYLVLLQATSPLLRAENIVEAVDIAQSDNFDSALSVVRQHRFLWREEDGGATSPANYEPAARPRRQDWRGELVENGAIYVTSKKQFDATHCRLGGRIGFVEMDEASYIELDSLTDWEIVAGLLRKRGTEWGEALRQRAVQIKFVASDVDGCLTDGGMYYTENGEEFKRFNTRDGKAFELLRGDGLMTGIITAETTQLVERRAKKLKIDELHQGASDKVAVMTEILERHNLDWSEVAYLGDDLGDIELMRRVAIAAAPSDAAGEALAVCHVPLRTAGGHGALREFVEALRAARHSG